MVTRSVQENFDLLTSLYPPQNGVLAGYTVFSMSVIPKFRHSEIPSTFNDFAL